MSRKLFVPAFLVAALVLILPAQAIAAPASARLVVDRPLVVDGEQYAPEEASRFDGVPLIFVVDRNALNDGAVYAFTSHKTLEVYLDLAHGQRLAAEDSPMGPLPTVVKPAVPQKASCPLTIAYFYEHVDYGGANMTVVAGQSITFGSSWWNDRISSVRAAGSWTILYEHHYWGGKEVWLEGCLNIRSLHSSNNSAGINFNFGDKTSSIRVLQ